MHDNFFLKRQESVFNCKFEETEKKINYIVVFFQKWHVLSKSNF